MNGAVQREPAAQTRRQARTAFPPGSGNNTALHRIALDAIKCRRLMRFVQDANRKQEQAAARGQRIVDVVLNISLLEFDRPFAAFDDRMLDFQLREKAGFRAEIVTKNSTNR